MATTATTSGVHFIGQILDASRSIRHERAIQSFLRASELSPDALRWDE